MIKFAALVSEPVLRPPATRLKEAANLTVAQSAFSELLQRTVHLHVNVL